MVFLSILCPIFLILFPEQLFFLNKIDDGNILHQFKILIQDNDTAFSLNHKIFDESLNNLERVLELVNLNDKGKEHKGGKFYYNKFPDISNLNNNLQEKIKYFPPNFI